MGITVPTVVTESIAPAPIRAPLQSVSGAGVDVSGLTEGIDQFRDAKVRAENQLSQIRISGAETEILNRWNARLVEDKDAFYKDGGQSGYERLEPSMQELDDIATEVMGGLKNGTERRILTEALTLRRMNHRSKMSLTAFDWRQDWDKDTALANRAAQFEAAVNDTSPENLRLTRERIIDETNAISKIDHLPEEAATLNAATAVSQMYTAAIEGVIANERPFLALEMLERYGDQIQADDKTALRDKLAEVTLASESRDLATDAAEHSNDPREQLKFIEKKYGKNPTPRQTEIIERATQKASINRNQIETADGIFKKENFDFLGARVIEQTTNAAGLRGIEIIEFLQRQFPDRFADESLSTAQRNALLAMVETGPLTESSAQGLANYYGAMELAATNPGELANLTFDDLAQFKSEMTPKQYGEVETAYFEARAAGITKETSATASRAHTLNRVSQKHGFTLSGTQADLSDTARLIQRESVERFDEFRAVNKRDPVEKEWQEIVDQLFIKVLLDDPRPPKRPLTLYGPIGGIADAFRSDIDPTTAFKLQLDDIPKSQREVVRSLFIAEFGRAPLPNEQETYFIGLMNDPTTRSLLIGK